jgi:hypothetical protein
LRNALLADVVTPSAYGRAYGFERAMDNLGAIGGPLIALALVGPLGVREAILLRSSRGFSPPSPSSMPSARRCGSSATNAKRSGCGCDRSCAAGSGG